MTVFHCWTVWRQVVDLNLSNVYVLSLYFHLECSAKALWCSLDDMSAVLCIARIGISLTFMHISGLGSDLCFMMASDGVPVINSFSCSSCWALCRLRDTSCYNKRRSCCMISGQILNAILQNEWAWRVFIVEEGPSVFIIKDWNLSLVFFTVKKESHLQASDEWFFWTRFFSMLGCFRLFLGFYCFWCFKLRPFIYS